MKLAAAWLSLILIVVVPALADPLLKAPASLRGGERLGDRVMHNPFGELNLNQGTVAAKGPASALVKAAAAASAKQQSQKPQPPAAPPPPPTAPPLPFTAVGSITGAQVTGGQPVAFVRQQDQLHVLRAGDSVGQLYRVDSINAQRIEFIYLPLMQRQALTLAP